MSPKATSSTKPLISTRTDFDNPKSPVYVKGAHFDKGSVDRVVQFFGLLRQLIGKWRGARFDLLDWQISWLISPVFGWKGPDGNRIIRTVWFEIPRKNGKSTLSSGLGLYLLCADREPGAQVYALAGDKKQASIVFDPAKQMAQNSPAIAKKIEGYRNSIVYPSTGSSFQVLASDGDRLHGLNVHGAVIDEVHVHKKRDAVDAVETGTGSREQPLIVFITTADDGDQTSIYAEKRAYLESVADGTIRDPSFYGVVFGAVETDDAFSDETLARANPGAGVTVKWDYLHQKAAEAQTSPGALNRYLRLHLNIRTRASVRWLDPTLWDANARMVVPSELAGRDCYGGFDLASTSDFTAWVMVFPPATDDDPIDVICRFWLPRAAVERRTSMRTTLEGWERAGWLTVTDGDVIDNDRIRREIEADASTFHILEVAHDPWNAGFAPQLAEQGMTIWPIAQTVTRLNAPSKELERLLGQHRLNHGGNPILRWMASNVMVYSDGNGNIKPDRKKSSEKIDGIAALVNALGASIREREAIAASVYERRGMVTL